MKEYIEDSERFFAEFHRVDDLKRRGDVAGLISLLANQWGNEALTIRARAAGALAELRSREAIEPVASLLNDDSEHVRIAAVKALAKVGGPDVVPHVVTALDDRSWSVRAWAADSLRKLGDQRGVDPMIERLEREQDLVVRRRLATALGKLGDPRAIGPLKRARSRTRLLHRRPFTKALRSLSRRSTSESTPLE